MAHGGGPGINHPPDMLAAVQNWREKGNAPYELRGKSVIDGKEVLSMPLFPYPEKTGWDTATSSFKEVEGPRGGVGKVADRFLPPASE
jgi:feruloyl esterase